MKPEDGTLVREGSDLRVRRGVRQLGGGLASQVHAIHPRAGAARISLGPAA